MNRRQPTNNIMARTRKSTSKNALRYKRQTRTKKPIPRQNIDRSTACSGDNVEIRLSLLRVQAHELTQDFQTRLTQAGFEYMTSQLQSLLSDVNRIQSTSKEDNKRIQNLKCAVNKLITQVQLNNPLPQENVIRPKTHFENDTVQNKSLITLPHQAQLESLRQKTGQYTQFPSHQFTVSQNINSTKKSNELNSNSKEPQALSSHFNTALQQRDVVHSENGLEYPLGDTEVRSSNTFMESESEHGHLNSSGQNQESTLHIGTSVSLNSTDFIRSQELEHDKKYEEQSNSSVKTYTYSSQGSPPHRSAPSDEEDYDSDCTVFDLSMYDEKATDEIHHGFTKLNLTNDTTIDNNFNTTDQEQILSKQMETDLEIFQTPLDTFQSHTSTNLNTNRLGSRNFRDDYLSPIRNQNVGENTNNNQELFQDDNYSNIKNTMKQSEHALNNTASQSQKLDQLFSSDGYIDKDSESIQNSPILLKSCSAKIPALKGQNVPCPNTSNSKEDEMSKVKVINTNNKHNLVNESHTFEISTRKEYGGLLSQTPPNNSNKGMADVNERQSIRPLLLKSELTTSTIFNDQEEAYGIAKDQTQNSDIAMTDPSHSPFKVPPIPCPVKKYSSNKNKNHKAVSSKSRVQSSNPRGGNDDSSKLVPPTSKKAVTSIKEYIVETKSGSFSDRIYPEKTFGIRHDEIEKNSAKVDTKTEIKTTSRLDTLLGEISRDMETTTSLAETIVDDVIPDPGTVNIVDVHKTPSRVAEISRDCPTQRSSQKPEHSLTKQNNSTKISQVTKNSTVLSTLNSQNSQTFLSNSQINTFLTDSQIEEMKSSQDLSTNYASGSINDQNIQSIMEIRTVRKSVCFTSDPDCPNDVSWTSEDLKQFFLFQNNPRFS